MYINSTKDKKLFKLSGKSIYLEALCSFIRSISTFNWSPDINDHSEPTGFLVSSSTSNVFVCSSYCRYFPILSPTLFYFIKKSLPISSIEATSYVTRRRFFMFIDGLTFIIPSVVCIILCYAYALILMGAHTYHIISKIIPTLVAIC